MKKVLSLAFAALGVGIISSCSSDEMLSLDSLDQKGIPSGKEIRFNAPYLGNVQTRSTVTKDNIKTQTLSVFADRKALNSSWTPAITSNTLSYEDNGWNLATSVNWYYNNSYRFSAAAPSTAAYRYTDGKVSLSDVPAVMEESIGTDYLVSNPILIDNVDDVVIDNGVNLSMKHIMSKFQFVVKNVGASTLRINSATIYLPDGNYTASYSQTAEAGNNLAGEWTWNSFENSSSFVASQMNGITFNTGSDLANNNATISKEYFIAPYNGINLFFDLDYELQDASGNVIKRNTVNQKKFTLNLSAGIMTKAIAEIDMDGNIRNIRMSVASLDDYQGNTDYLEDVAPDIQRVSMEMGNPAFSPSDATVKINGQVVVDKYSAVVGSTINWELSKNGYETKTGSAIVTEGASIASLIGAVTLNPLVLHEKDGYVQFYSDGPYWSKYNLGASKAEDNGMYYTWDGITGYSKDTWPGNFPLIQRTPDQLMEAGIVDNNGNLTPAFDAATVAGMGRTPTKDEWKALINNTEWTWTTVNGIAGHTIKGKGEYALSEIFLPASGAFSNSTLNDEGRIGKYWTSTCYDVNDGYQNSCAYHLYTAYYGASVEGYSVFRAQGHTIRPIKD